jgi:hypothetical protein
MKLLKRQRKIAISLGFIFVSIAATSSYAQQAKKLKNGTFLIDNFQEDTVGNLPAGWYNRDGGKKVSRLDAKTRARYHYEIKKSNGNKFLRYDGTEAMHLNFLFTNRDHENIYNINVYENPVLSWKWRVFKLPEGADVDAKNRNDAAASIYVVWDFGHVLFKKVPKSVRYVWGNKQPKGTELSKFFGNQKIVVVQSGSSDEGKWISFHRNIVKDYEHLFGDKPPKAPLAILILSDGDNTHSRAKADYDDIMLKPAKAVEAKAHN